MDFEYAVPFVKAHGRGLIEGLAVFETEEDAQKFAFSQGGNDIFYRPAGINPWTELEDN